MGIVEAEKFIVERTELASEPTPHWSMEKAHRNKFVFKSGDAVLVGERVAGGYNIVTVIRSDRLNRKMKEGGLLRKKVRKS